MKGRTLNKNEVAEFFGVHLSTVNTWVRKGCPVESKGTNGKDWRMDSKAVHEWREQLIVDRLTPDTQGMDIEEARLRKVAAEAAMVELDLAVRKGELLEMDAIAELCGNDYANLRAKLLAMPYKLASQAVTISDTVEMTALIESLIVEALEELTVDGIYPKRDSVRGKAAPAKAGKSKAAA